jgi:2-C-methyl-D-erythritol 4-phosphate cytidylyltransferase
MKDLKHLYEFEKLLQDANNELVKKAKDDGAEVTDDCSAVERLGMSIKIVEGDERNIKVTTPMDLKIAKLLLEDTQ